MNLRQEHHFETEICKHLAALTQELERARDARRVVDLFNPFVCTEEFRENLQRNEGYAKGWDHARSQK